MALYDMLSLFIIGALWSENLYFDVLNEDTYQHNTIDCPLIIDSQNLCEVIVVNANLLKHSAL